MRFLVIRDDDLSFWTSLDEIYSVHEHLFSRKIKVSFAVIPFAVKMFYLGDFNSFYQDINNSMPLDKNKDLVEYLKEKINLGLVEIMLHGYNHIYFFRYGKDILPATFENLKPFRDSGRKVYFLGEYACQDYHTLKAKTKEGKKYLEDIFGIKIKNFVPPSNQISKEGIRAIIDNKLNLSGLIGKTYNRELTLRGLFSFIDRIFWKIRYKDITYPKVVNYGFHKELVGYTLSPSSDFKRIYKQLDFCSKNNYPFQIATHYWELKGILKYKFYELIDNIMKRQYESKFLMEVI